MSELEKPRLKPSHRCCPAAGSALMGTGTKVGRDGRSFHTLLIPLGGEEAEGREGCAV